METLPLVARAPAMAARAAIARCGRVAQLSEPCSTRPREWPRRCSPAATISGRRASPIFIPPGFDHVAVQWGIWRAGGIAVPLAISHPPPELEYVLRRRRCDQWSWPIRLAPRSSQPSRDRAGSPLPRHDPEPSRASAAAAPARSLRARRAMMVYTSGTTGKPKGVVTTHANLAAQITALIEAWEWSADDRILLVLPLHHVHGIVNVVCCALWAGAALRDPSASSTRTTPGPDRDRASSPCSWRCPPSIARLIAAWDAAPARDSERRMSAGCRRLRLMVSGSAALPVADSGALAGDQRAHAAGALRDDRDRHGALQSAARRAAARLGRVRRCPESRSDWSTRRAPPVAPGSPGEIEVRGPERLPGVLAPARGDPRRLPRRLVPHRRHRGARRRRATASWAGAASTSSRPADSRSRRSRSRRSCGPIRRSRECAVVGVPDDEWGERVSAGGRADARRGARRSRSSRRWARERLAPYKVPRALRIVSRRCPATRWAR